MVNTVTINWEKYPYTGGKASVEFYRLTEDVVNTVVPDGIMPGNYRIGRLKDKKFKIIYVGRVDDRDDDGLKDRIKEHIGEWEGDLWFDWKEADDVEAAYKQECIDYHAWGGKDSLENIDHPAKPKGKTNLKCPKCNQ